MQTIWILVIITPGLLYGYNKEVKVYDTVSECIAERNALYAKPEHSASFIYCKDETFTK